MDGRDSIQSLLVRRKLTRAIADLARAQMLEYLGVLAPLLRPRTVLGDFIHGSTKEGAPRAEKAYKELQASYSAIAPTRPFHLTDDLTPPLNFAGHGLDITPVDYPHVIGAGDDQRTIMVRSPFSWSLTYSGYASDPVAGAARDAHQGQRRAAAVRAQPPAPARGHRQLARARVAVRGPALPADHDHDSGDRDAADHANRTVGEDHAAVRRRHPRNRCADGDGCL